MAYADMMANLGSQAYAYSNLAGMPLATDILPGMSNYLRGVLALETYGAEAAAMNTAWGWDYAYSKEGMAFVPNFAYYNAANQTGWYFGADVSQVQTGVEAGPGIATGYTFVNEAPETIAAGAGLFGLFGLGPIIPFGITDLSFSMIFSFPFHIETGIILYTLYETIKLENL